jgi:hypothetical protein
VYHYTTMAAARQMVQFGIPVFSGGVIFSLKGPHQVKKGDHALHIMSPLSPSRECVLCVSLPRESLHPFVFHLKARDGFDLTKSRDSSDYLVAVNAEILVAMALMRRADEDVTAILKGWGSIQVRGKPLHPGEVPDEPPLVVPITRILRAYQLVDDDNLREFHGVSLSQLVCMRTISPVKEAMHIIKRGVLPISKEELDPAAVTVIRTCAEYLAAMRDAREACRACNLVPLYYYSTPFVAEYIHRDGFRVDDMGTASNYDDGVYFCHLSPASFGLGTTEYEKNLIVSHYGVSKLKQYRERHMFDVCFVYAAEPRTLRVAPGRDNAELITEAFFASFGEFEPVTANYLLRPDHIVAAFVMDPLLPPTGASEEKICAAMAFEVEQDKATLAQIRAVEFMSVDNANFTRGINPKEVEIIDPEAGLSLPQELPPQPEPSECIPEPEPDAEPVMGGDAAVIEPARHLQMEPLQRVKHAKRIVADAKVCTIFRLNQ